MFHQRDVRETICQGEMYKGCPPQLDLEGRIHQNKRCKSACFSQLCVQFKSFPRYQACQWDLRFLGQRTLSPTKRRTQSWSHRSVEMERFHLRRKFQPVEAEALRAEEPMLCSRKTALFNLMGYFPLPLDPLLIVDVVRRQRRRQYSLTLLDRSF